MPDLAGIRMRSKRPALQPPEQEVEMADQGSIGADKVTKPCVCQLGVHVGLYKATGKIDDRGWREFRCRLCGRTEWRSA